MNNKLVRFFATSILLSGIVKCSSPVRSEAYRTDYVEEQEEPEPTIKFYGYIKYETFADSRQVIAFADTQDLLLPAPQLLDVNNRDINSRGQANMAAFETRSNIDITGPTILGAKSSGKMQLDFWSALTVTLSRLRMRRGYAQLFWKHVELLAGQTYHPMFLLECFPDNIAFNKGNPIALLAYNPQFRLTAHVGPFDFSGSMADQRFGESPGPNGTSSEYMRNAIIPNLNLQLHANINKHILGAAVNFKRLIPRIVTELNVKAIEVNDSVAVFAFTAFNWEKFFLHIKGLYVENGADITLPGGYAVATVNTITDRRTYTNLRIASIWADLAGKVQSFEPGIFIGYVKNLGAPKDIITQVTVNGETESTIYTNINSNLDYAFRVSPRVRWFVKDATFAVELE